MAISEIGKISDDQLDQVVGGLYGGSSGHWVPASVNKTGGIPYYRKEGAGFVTNTSFVIPNGEDLTVDMNRKTGMYVVAFFNDEEVWIKTTDVEWI